MNLLSRRIIWLCLLSAAAAGCTRTHYRVRADRDTYSLIHEKTACAPWQPSRFTINPPRHSRLFDPTPPDDPLLPIPAPTLYAYRLPEVPSRDPARFRPENSSAHRPAPVGEPSTSPLPTTGFQGEILRLPSGTGERGRDGVQLAHAVATPGPDVALALYAPPAAAPPLPHAPGSETTGGQSESYESLPRPETEDDEFAMADVVPIPSSVWESIPTTCLQRMFEFESIREEFERTYGQPPSEEQRDSAEHLALEDLLELALINSREYQTQKEQLYRAALRLTFERYQYQLKFSPTGNGVDVNWQHARNAGITQNTLGIFSSASVEKVLTTGGTFLARLANDVILTFNGPNGWAANVGSEIFVELNQRLLQRDIVFESLTQAERNVVYAARDYARFRKLFFRDIAADYYGLLLAFREIEISTQQFFSNQRNFEQGRSIYLTTGRIGRTQVDLIEQDALANRSSLIEACNNLEQNFDQLKLRIGIPPETPINLDLEELEQLTTRDEAVVAAELVRRARRNLDTERRAPAPDQAALISAATNLARLVLEMLSLQDSAGDENADQQAVRRIYHQLRVEEARLVVEQSRNNLQAQLEAERPSPLYILQLRLDLVRALLMLGNRRQRVDGPLSAARLNELGDEFEILRQQLDDIEQNLDRIPELVRQSGLLLDQVDAVVGDAMEQEPTSPPAEIIEAIVTISQRLTTGDAGGLAPIDLPVDDAMLTALVSRFDLMNVRGDLADTWRQIKLAGDDLRSVLNLRASQSIRTRSDVNRPFDFTFDESTTNLGFNFDAPLNRRAQRNDYRVSLINYHAAMRNLMELEDRIKVDVRNDLRDLQLDQNQYAIAVASAALANQRILTTRLELRLGIGQTTSRDVVESQQAYSQSLFNVARRHITYILDRIDLFLDLELLEVDESGIWPQLYDDSHQPTPRFQPPPCSGPPYGRLPPVHYSHPVRRMEQIPFGNPLTFDFE